MSTAPELTECACACCVAAEARIDAMQGLLDQRSHDAGVYCRKMMQAQELRDEARAEARRLRLTSALLRQNAKVARREAEAEVRAALALGQWLALTPYEHEILRFLLRCPWQTTSTIAQYMEGDDRDVGRTERVATGKALNSLRRRGWVQSTPSGTVNRPSLWATLEREPTPHRLPDYNAGSQG